MYVKICEHFRHFEDWEPYNLGTILRLYCFILHHRQGLSATSDEHRPIAFTILIIDLSLITSFPNIKLATSICLMHCGYLVLKCVPYVVFQKMLIFPEVLKKEEVEELNSMFEPLLKYFSTSKSTFLTGEHDICPIVIS